MVFFDIADIVPTISVDMAEPETPARKGSHVGYGDALAPESLLKKREWVDEPLRAPCCGLLVDEISAGGVTPAIAGQHHARGHDQVAVAMLEDEERRNFRVERAHNGKGGQHRIKLPLKPDEGIAVEDLGGVGDVDAGATQSKPDLPKHAVGIGQRSVARNAAVREER